MLVSCDFAPRVPGRATIFPPSLRGALATNVCLVCVGAGYSKYQINNESVTSTLIRKPNHFYLGKILLGLLYCNYYWDSICNSLLKLLNIAITFETVLECRLLWLLWVSLVWPAIPLVWIEVNIRFCYHNKTLDFSWTFIEADGLPYYFECQYDIFYINFDNFVIIGVCAHEHFCNTSPTPKMRHLTCN